MINQFELCALLEKQALENDNIYIVCGDNLDLLFFPKMVKQARDRVVACGISEQNQVSVANGIALQGKKVYCMMMDAFLLHRALDQVKMACYSNTDIKFIGFSPNIVAIEGGYSHISIDDFAILRQTPNLEIYDPYTQDELETVAKKCLSNSGPVYIACVVDGVNALQFNSHHVGGFSRLMPGSHDFCIITSGDAVNFLCYENTLREIGIRYKLPTLYTVWSVQPFDEEMCRRIIKKYKNIVVVEVRGTGGLASMVGELIAKMRLKRNFLPVYFGNKPFNVVGYRNVIGMDLLSLRELPEKLQKLFAPFKLGFKKEKLKFLAKTIYIRRQFLGVTYDKRKILPGKVKRWIFGFIPIKLKN